MTHSETIISELQMHQPCETSESNVEVKTINRFNISVGDTGRVQRAEASRSTGPQLFTLRGQSVSLSNMNFPHHRITCAQSRTGR